MAAHDPSQTTPAVKLSAVPPLSELADRLPIVLCRYRYDGARYMLYISEGCTQLTGYRVEALLGEHARVFNHIITPRDYKQVQKQIAECIRRGEAIDIGYRIETAGGERRWLRERGRVFHDEAAESVVIDSVLTDETRLRRQLESLAHTVDEKDEERLLQASLLNEYRRAVDAGAIVSRFSPRGRITYVNEQFCGISGHSRSELMGKHWSVLRHPTVSDGFVNDVWQVLSAKQIWRGILKNKNAQGVAYYTKSTIVPVLGPGSEIREYIAISSDVTDLIRQSKRIKLQTTDQLTHLPNRQKLVEDLQRESHAKLAIFNLCRFKDINEFYGFAIGDRLLIEVSNLLLSQVQEPDLRLYKLAGDEFALLATAEVPTGRFIHHCHRLLKTLLSHHFHLDGDRFSLTAVAGAAQQQNLLNNAEIAKNFAREGDKAFVFFDASLGLKDQLKKNIRWTTKLRDALREDRIQVVAQPLFDNRTGEQSKYECLARMVDNDGAVVLPIHFMQIAKRARLYAELTRVVCEKACCYFADKYDEFSINLTIEDLMNPRTLRIVQECITRYEVANRLTLELVESEGIEKESAVRRALDLFKAMGCKIAIDDFGTGYSNFDYLMRLDVDYIKIDGSIIRNLDRDANARVVTEVIISFARQLNIKTIAEYVHSRSIHQAVISMGIDYSQGHYLGEPKILEL